MRESRIVSPSARSGMQDLFLRSEERERESVPESDP